MPPAFGARSPFRPRLQQTRTTNMVTVRECSQRMCGAWPYRTEALLTACIGVLGSGACHLPAATGQLGTGWSGCIPFHGREGCVDIARRLRVSHGGPADCARYYFGNRRRATHPPLRGNWGRAGAGAHRSAGAENVSMKGWRSSGSPLASCACTGTSAGWEFQIR
jgi:hypothetical protein